MNPTVLTTTAVVSALISALVAALVTLAIEWFAKPSLEARKARILEEVAHQRAALRACREILVCIGAMRALPSRDIETRQWKELREGHRARLAAAVDALFAKLVDVGTLVPEDAVRLASRTAGFLRGRLTHKGDIDVEPALEPMLAVAAVLERFGVGRWFAMRRVRFLLAASVRDFAARPKEEEPPAAATTYELAPPPVTVVVHLRPETEGTGAALEEQDEKDQAGARGDTPGSP